MGGEGEGGRRRGREGGGGEGREEEGKGNVVNMMYVAAGTLKKTQL